MPEPTAADVERLLTPISAEAPAGVSLRYEGTYDKIREARREDDPSIPTGVWERTLKVADYGAVQKLGDEALERRSKDLQIAAWLVDTWAHVYGLAGVRRGIELTAGMCARFWDAMFPVIEDGEEEARARIFDWVDDALALRIRTAQLGDERAQLTFHDWERAKPGVETDGPSREALLARMTMIGAARWAAVHDDLGAALASAQALDGVLEAHLEAPVAMRRLEETLRAMQVLCNDVLKAAGGRPAAPAPPATKETDGMNQTPPTESAEGSRQDGPPGQIKSRADAYRWLTEAADYLLRTEPHSPVPYLIKRAITWGNMSLAELLQEFISGSDDLVVTHRLLGMRGRDE